MSQNTVGPYSLGYWAEKHELSKDELLDFATEPFNPRNFSEDEWREFNHGVGQARIEKAYDKAIKKLLLMHQSLIEAGEVE